ncbi:type II 3-dehydroquinate dehydratase [Paraglaciecola sp.]|uniref:type II 3-dehydroquinate dehydratase n=1 Tax=Paraglaciecola sp. TaxID=1920173 RepID=UPI003EF3A5E2
MKLLVINGPNLNMLGKREPDTYGHQSLETINLGLEKYAQSLGFEVSFVQSNAEHVLIDTIHNAFNKVDFIVINPGAFTHTSVALRDALLSVSIPFIEVHLSNVHARESFRQHSYLSDVAQGVICGLGSQGYEFAIAAAKNFLNK